MKMSEEQILKNLSKDTLIKLYLSARPKAEAYDTLKRLFSEMLGDSE